MPASFPGSIKTFTTKNTADTIEASHINDLQDEVTAIEGGIRNGTAPINSSNSTVLSLNVTGNAGVNGQLGVGVLNVVNASTFAGSVNMGGTLTFKLPFVLGATMAAATLSSGNTNDLAILSTVVIAMVSPNSSGSTLTGLAFAGGASEGLTLQFRNPTGSPLVLAHATGSASTGQFRCPGNTAFTIRAQGAVWITYDDVVQHAWMVIAP